MTSFEIRVELPAHSHSFCIQAESQWSIHEVKNEIQRTCVGAPKPDGQRLIWRGRFLKDEEMVQDIWKVCPFHRKQGDAGLTVNNAQSSTDSHIVHLSVHPSAWTNTPPNQPTEPTALATRAAQRQPRRQPKTPWAALPVPPIRAQAQQEVAPVSPTPIPLEFIQNKHDIALHVLTQGSLPTSHSPQVVPRANPAFRAHAQNVLAMHGYSWPSTLDEEYPPTSESDQGVRYSHVVVE